MVSSARYFSSDRRFDRALRLPTRYASWLDANFMRVRLSRKQLDSYHDPVQRVRSGASPPGQIDPIGGCARAAGDGRRRHVPVGEKRDVIERGGGVAQGAIARAHVQ